MRQFMLAILFFAASADAQSIDCAAHQSRALVLSGGGAKGAFEAGAVYHLVVHRHCDFNEVSGVSVGALNGALLAQAPSSSDPKQSLQNLEAQAEQLVSVWNSIRGPQDIFKKRFLGMLRFGLFGTENINDFTPLQKLIRDKVSPSKLLLGRTIRIGVVSFWDGRYREIVASKTSERENQTFLDYVYASSLIPIYGRMPKIQDDVKVIDQSKWTQFADAGLRRVTPVSSYFRTCNSVAIPFTMTIEKKIPCTRNATKWIPDHDRPISQLFVIVSSPYSRLSDEAATPDLDKCCQKGTRQFSNGHKILDRTITLSVGIPYRWDLDFGQIANEFLRWRQDQRDLFIRVADTAKLSQFEEESKRLNGDSPVESYNPGETPESPSLPYDIRLIVPHKIFADVYGFDPSNIREQLYCGCISADQVMSNGDPEHSMSLQCAKRFPALADANMQIAKWNNSVCQVNNKDPKQ